MKLDAPKRLGVVVATLGLAAPAWLFGQSAPANQTADAADPKKEEVVTLNVFRVDATKDTGYLAANSVSGTRLNTPIKNLPMQIEVVTKDFMRDIGAVDPKEALAYTAGVVQDTVQGSNSFLFSPSQTGQVSGSTPAPDRPSFNIRGYNTRFLLRNGFRIDTVTDGVNVERIEVVRGPQAILYGVSALAGVVDVLPAQPRAGRRTTVNFGYGSEDYLRGEVQTTGSFLKRGNFTGSYALGLVYQDISDYTDFNDRNRTLFTPTFEINYGRNTRLLVDAEIGRFKDEGIGFQDVNDSNPANIRNELGVAVSTRNVFNETLLVARDAFGRNREFRWSGADTFSKRDYQSYTAQLEQSLFDDSLALIAAGNYSYTETDERLIDSQATNLTLGTTLPTTPGIWVDAGANPLNPAQRMYKGISYQWAMPFTKKTILQSRFQAAYKFDVFGTSNRVLLGRQDTEVVSSALSTAQVTTNGGSTAGNRSYIAYNDLSYIRYQGETVRPFRENEFTEWNTGHYAILTSEMFNKRLNLLGGYRWDRYMVRSLNWTYGKRDTAQADTVLDNWVRPDNYDEIATISGTTTTFNNVGANAGSAASSVPGDVPRVAGYRFGGKTQYEENPMLGANFAVTKDINVYVSTGSGLFPNTGQRDGAGGPFSAEMTKGVEAGLKLGLFKDENDIPKVSVTASVFRTERENGIYNVFWAPQPRSNNRARPRAGVPAGGYTAFGTGTGAYGVYSSGFSDFETSQPVTYLLPVSYVAAADLTHPRVTGAPQQGGFILVDYASLGTAANDPIRRAMDAAAGDAANRTALQTAAIGSGGTGLFANNAYALNRNSDVSYDDESTGAELEIILNPFKGYQAKIGYALVKQEVTGGFRIVDQPRSTEYDSWWNYMGIPLAERAANLNEASYDFSGGVKGARTVDVPEHVITAWNAYTIQSGALKNLTVGVGLTYRASRQSEVVINNGVQSLVGVENQRFKPPYPEDVKADLLLAYRTRVGNYPLRLALNVRNVLDDQKDAAFGESVLFINPATGLTTASTTAGAQRVVVPERSILYFNPISFRFSASVEF